MSTRVVSESHTFGDDYTWVPSSDEFDELSETVKGLSRKVTNVSTAMNAVDRRMDSQDKKLASIAEKMTSVSNVVKMTKEEIKAELTNGEWKSALQKLVKDATTAFESKLRDAGRFSADKISELIKQEAATRSLVDKIQALRESALSDISNAGKECEKALQTSVSRIEKIAEEREQEWRDCTAKLNAGLEDSNRLQAQNKQAMAIIEEATSAISKAKVDAEAVFDKVDQRGNELNEVIKSNSDNHNVILKFRMWLTVQAVAILLLTAVVVWLAVK